MRLSAVEVEEKPGDKRSFNLLYKSDLRVFELVAQTATERKTLEKFHLKLKKKFFSSWFRLIENQVSVTRSSPIPTDFDNILDGILTSGVQQQQNRATPPPLLAQRANVVDSGLQHQVAKVEHVHVLTHPALVNAVSFYFKNLKNNKTTKVADLLTPIIFTRDRTGRRRGCTRCL